MEDLGNLAWNMFSELRKELVEAQRIRTQLIGFKITFIGTAVGLIVAHQPAANLALLAVPAVAAVFFDLLIVGYNVSILRIGFYCLTNVEPTLRAQGHWPANALLWEEFMHQPGLRGMRPAFANLGITAIAVVLGIISTIHTLPVVYSALCGIVLVGLFIFDCLAHLRLPPLLRKAVRPEIPLEINGSGAIITDTAQ